MSGHWGENEIRALLDKGIVKGDNSGSLRLKDTVTRAEFISLLLRAMGEKVEPYAGEFADITANDWYAGEFAAAKKLGIVNGFDDNTARPNEVINREQMAKLLVEACEKNTQQGTAMSYNDMEQVSEWAKPYVYKATDLGLLQGDDRGCIRPKDSVMREQAFIVAYRLLNMINSD